MVSGIVIIIWLAYMIGSIPTSVWVGKIFFKIDVREHGSKNAGATNAIRVFGWKACLPVFLFDVFKGWLAVMLSEFFLSHQLDNGQLVFLKIGLAAADVLGHVFPMFAGFRGGKGVATLLGVGMAIYPLTVWVVLFIFVAVLLITGYVSLGSLTGAILFPLIDIFVFKQDNIWLIGLAVLVALFIPLTHRNNIRRLLKGTESKFRPTKYGNKRSGSV
jgi:acyl phosphate:glycerol-3-phosphate acyltransferase